MKKIFAKNQRIIFNNIELVVALSIMFIITLNCSNSGKKDTFWINLAVFLENIDPPVFNHNEFNIIDFGAKGDGKTDCTKAFANAINICSEAGGGRVIIPEGVFLSGAIHLKSNVNLHLKKNSKILFYNSPEYFLPNVYTRFEGVECYNYSPLIYAYNQKNIAVTGSGTLDGQAGSRNWWSWKGKKEYGWTEDLSNGKADTDNLFQMAENGVPVEDRIFGQGHYLRTNFIQFYKCQNVLIDSVSIIRSPMWVIHPVLCENVTVQNVIVNSHGPNNDGCNPESSKNVLIKNCTFNTGDDCIAIKSGRNEDGRRVNVASENIVIQQCTMVDGHGGVVIGSETSGSIKNIYVENCVMDSPNLDRALRIKTNSRRGGLIENIYMRNCMVGEVSEAVLKINYAYEEGDVGKNTPVVRNIYLDNIKSKKSQYAIYLEGYSRSPITNLNISNCEFDGVQMDNVLINYKDLNLIKVKINKNLSN